MPKEKQSEVCPVEPRLLGIKQAATYLSATVWALRKMCWNRQIPHVRIGQRLLFDRADLDQYVDKVKVA
jgi:excisionase family DNA binding protein